MTHFFCNKGIKAIFTMQTWNQNKVTKENLILKKIKLHRIKL